MELLPVDPLDRLRLRRSVKWRQHDPDVLPLTVAEMDFPLAEPIRDVLTTAIERADTGYGMPIPDLGMAFAGFARRRWNWTVDPTAVVATTDVSTGVVDLLRVLTRPGDAVVVNPPVYPPFHDWVSEAGARRVDVPLAGNRLDLAALEQAFRSRPAAYLLCNPHNPVGRVHTPDELTAVVELATRYEVPVVSDEIHAPLVLPGATFTPLLTIPGAAEIAVVLMSTSKAWNLAGLKCAMIVSDSPRMRTVVEGLPVDAKWRIGHFGVLASIAAYESGEPWLDRLLATLADRRAALTEFIRTRLPMIDWQPPEATYLAWLDCRRSGLDDPRESFLAEGRVALEPGARFGLGGAGHVRLNFGTSTEILDAATARMAAMFTPPAHSVQRTGSESQAR